MDDAPRARRRDDPRARWRDGTAPSRVGVVGAGLIGGSITRAYLAAAVDVMVVDRDPAVGQRAERAGASVDTLAGIADRGDVAFLCPPPTSVAPVWDDLARVAEGRTARSRLVALDAASVKRPVRDGVAERAAAWSTDDAVLLLSHPMAGREMTGWDASDPTLFRGASWILLPSDEVTGGEVARAVAAVEALGATACFMDPGFHDRFAGLTSHLAHALAFVFQAQVDALDRYGWRRFSGNSLRDLLRVAGADHDLWTEILGSNEDELRPLLQDLGTRLAAFDPATDVPETPPVDPTPDRTGPDGRPVTLTFGWDEPLGARCDDLLVTGEHGLHVDDVEVDQDTGEVRFRFGAPVASSS